MRMESIELESLEKINVRSRFKTTRWLLEEGLTTIEISLI